MQTNCLFEVYRLVDGKRQLLGCYSTEEEADSAYDYYSEVKYPHSHVDIEYPED